jgi:hypothetical protein
MKNSELVEQFIDQIWNNRDFNSLDKYVHDAFKDHSLHRPLPGNKSDLKNWIEGIGASFEHKTIIESQVNEGDLSIVKIKMELKHTGIWRNIDPTGFVLETTDSGNSGCLVVKLLSTGH